MKVTLPVLGPGLPLSMCETHNGTAYTSRGRKFRKYWSILIFFCFQLCVFVHMCMYMNAGDVGSKKIMSYVLDLELQARLF